MQSFTIAAFVGQKRRHVMRAHVINAHTLVAFEQQSTDQSGGDDFGIGGAAAFFAPVMNALEQIVCETINRNNFIGEHRKVKFYAAIQNYSLTYAPFLIPGNLSYYTTEQAITADYIATQLDRLSLSICKPTVVVLDNARVHTAQSVKKCLDIWQNRGLYLFYLPPYSPHLNIIERLWKELKARWLRAEDYQTADKLFYAVYLALAAVGTHLFIRFSDFKL